MTIGVFAKADVSCHTFTGVLVGVFAKADVSCYSFASGVSFGIFIVATRSCQDTVEIIANRLFYMRARDEDGAQYVYWETENQNDYPVVTVPVAIGILTDFRILSQRII